VTFRDASVAIRNPKWSRVPSSLSWHGTYLFPEAPAPVLPRRAAPWLNAPTVTNRWGAAPQRQQWDTPMVVESAEQRLVAAE
jgi:hypothetical protein